MTNTINNIISGFLLIDKPVGATSMSIVKKLQYIFKQKKIGHTGTLDPFATGVLPICLGHTTKFTQCFHNANKTYKFEITFGTETNTGDITGDITQQNNQIPTQNDLQNILSSFLGKQKQKPHKFSAIHINGVRAYKLARQGINIEMPEKEIEIYSLKLLSMNHNKATLEVVCGSGTYVRSLAIDIAFALNCIAHTSKLRRTTYANITENDLISIDDKKILESTYDQNHLISLIKKHYPIIEITEHDRQKDRLLLGQRLYCPELDNLYNQPNTALATYQKSVLGLVNIKDNVIHPYKIITS